MNKINIITSPDQLFNNSFEILLIYPSANLKNELQDKFLEKYNGDVNVYVFDKEVYNKDEIVWLLKVFKSVDIALIDVDNTRSFFRDMLAYLIAKNKTYWLTNAVDSVYSILSSNQIYNLDFLINIPED